MVNVSVPAAALVRPRHSRALLCMLVGATVGAALVWFGPPGTDLAAHLYQRGLFLKDGYALWNNYWYDGRYSFVTYSLSYYPLAAAVGINLLATLSVAAGAWAFSVVVDKEWGSGARSISLIFAVTFAVSVLSGAFPYMLGIAFGLLSLVALQRRRLTCFGVLVLATFAASPLAFLLLVLVLAAVLARPGRQTLRAVVPVVLTALFGVLLWRLFPGNGRYPFALSELFLALGFSALGLACTWRVERARVLFNFYAIYAVACLASYLIPSDVGANIVRLRFMAIPLTVLTISLRRWKRLVPIVAVVAFSIVWNVSPIAASYVRGTTDPSSSASYWAPAISYLRLHLGPSYRVEAVDTTGHWEAYFLPAANIPLVRGWYRQDDFPENAILYHPLTAHAYMLWLHRMAVGYVVLTDAPPDYSARAEAKLLRSGRSGLRVVFRTASTTIFAVPSPTSIVAGPARPRVLAFSSSSITLDLREPGVYHVSLRYTPYWRALDACVDQAHGGLITLHAFRAGVLHVGFAMTATGALHALTGSRSSCDLAVRERPLG